MATTDRLSYDTGVSAQVQGDLMGIIGRLEALIGERQGQVTPAMSVLGDERPQFLRRRVGLPDRQVRPGPLFPRAGPVLISWLDPQDQSRPVTFSHNIRPGGASR